MRAGKRLVNPINRYLLCTRLVALVNHHLYELGLVKLCGNHNLLTLLDVNAAAGNQIRILLKSCLVHYIILFLFIYS